MTKIQSLNIKEKFALARSLVIDQKENWTLNQKKENHLKGKDAEYNMNEFFLTAMPYKGTIYIHIGHLAESHGRLIATKKGVTFPMDRWLKFESLLPDTQSYTENTWQENEEAHWHVGGGVYFIITEQSYGGLWTKHLKKTNRLSIYYL